MLRIEEDVDKKAIKKLNYVKECHLFNVTNLETANNKKYRYIFCTFVTDEQFKLLEIVTGVSVEGQTPTIWGEKEKEKMFPVIKKMIEPELKAGHYSMNLQSKKLMMKELDGLVVSMLHEALKARADGDWTLYRSIMASRDAVVWARDGKKKIKGAILNVQKKNKKKKVETTTEFCSACGEDVRIPAYGESKCPECGEPILPCSVCNVNGEFHPREVGCPRPCDRGAETEGLEKEIMQD